MSEELKKYEVLHAVSHKGERVEVGSIVELTEGEAAAWGPDYVTPVNTNEETTMSDENKQPENVPAPENVTAGQPGTEQETVGSDESKLVDHVVTQEDLDNNPELKENGMQVGETIQVPAPENTEA